MAEQIPLILPSTDWKPRPAVEWPDWPTHGRIAYDLETKDPDLPTLGPAVRRDGYPVGYGFQIEGGPGFYLPIRHRDGDNVEDADQATRYIQRQAIQFEGELVGANLLYDLDWSTHDGIVFPNATIRDVQIAEPLIDEHRPSYSLAALCDTYGLPGKVNQLMIEAASGYGWKGKAVMENLWKLPARFVGAYNEGDLDRPLRLYEKQREYLDNDDLWRVFELESALVPVLLATRQLGVRLDMDKLEACEAKFSAREQHALKKIKDITGITVSSDDLWKAHALVKPLEAQGFIIPTTPKKGAPSITAPWLEEQDDPVATAIVRARRMNKARTTFCASLRRFQVKGRIHCELHQLRQPRGKVEGDERGPRYGRFSSSHPNLQQQPIRDEEIGPLFRSIFVPDGDGRWLCADYSQQEPRITLHYAALGKCPGAAEAVQKYIDDPDTDNHAMMAELTGTPRRTAKDIFLGLVYGMQGARLCDDLGLPTDTVVNDNGRMFRVAGKEGQAILDNFDQKVPWVGAVIKAARAKADARGYMLTLLGRRCRFPKKERGWGYDFTYKALNRSVQGGAADQTKQAMVDLFAETKVCHFPVHDELNFTVGGDKEVQIIGGFMRDAIKLVVPMKVDLNVGDNWGEVS